MSAVRHDVAKIACGRAAHTGFALPVAPQATNVSLPGWRPVPSALGWRSAKYPTAACDHSGVVLMGGSDGCCISLKAPLHGTIRPHGASDYPVHGSIVTCDMSLECPGHVKIG